MLYVSYGRSVASATRVSNLYSFVACLSGIGAGLVVRRIRRLKIMMISGVCLFAAGFGIVIRYRGGPSEWAGMVGGQVVLGVAGGFFTYPGQVAIQAAVEHQCERMCSRVDLADGWRQSPFLGSRSSRSGCSGGMALTRVGLQQIWPSSHPSTWLRTSKTHHRDRWCNTTDCTFTGTTSERRSAKLSPAPSGRKPSRPSFYPRSGTQLSPTQSTAPPSPSHHPTRSALESAQRSSPRTATRSCCSR